VIGCSPLIDPKGRGAILFDIGGGSSELVRIERNAADPNGRPDIKAWMSIPLGVVTLAEKFGGKNVTRDSYDLMIAEVARHVVPFAAEHGADLAGMHLLGTSGTVTTLAGIHQGLARYDRRRIDGIWLDNAELDATITKRDTDGHDLCRAGGKPVHWPRPRRSRPVRLCDPRRDP